MGELIDGESVGASYRGAEVLPLLLFLALALVGCDRGLSACVIHGVREFDVLGELGLKTRIN